MSKKTHQIYYLKRCRNVFWNFRCFISILFMDFNKVNSDKSMKMYSNLDFQQIISMNSCLYIHKTSVYRKTIIKKMNKKALEHTNV